MEEVNGGEQTARPSKLRSAKLWITLWAMAMATFIIVADRSAYTVVLQWLCATPLAYIGANVWQKKIFSQQGQEE